MRSLQRTIGYFLLVMAIGFGIAFGYAFFKDVAFGHDIIGITGEQTCDGWTATVEANIFANHVLVVEVNDTVLREAIPGQDQTQIITRDFSGPENDIAIEVTAWIESPRGGIENGPVSLTLPFNDECVPETTTTTVQEETTTTVVETTTTTVVESTTTTEGPTTTTEEETTSTTTVTPSEPELPYTGADSSMIALVALGLGSLGALVLTRFREDA